MRRSRSGQATSFLSVLVVVGLLASEASAESLPLIAAELGITPESLVVAGVSSTGVSPVFSDLNAESQLRAQLAERKAAADSTAQSVTQLASTLASAPQPGQTQQYQDAMASLQVIRQEIDQVRDTLFAAVTVDLAPQQVQTLEFWRASEDRKVPPQFRVSQRTDQQWTAIELALKAEARAIRHGQQTPAEHAQVLNAVRSEPAVIMAQNALALHLGTMQAAFPSQ